MHQRVVPGPDRLVDYRHTRLPGSSASLPYVAARARADDILPLRFSARAPRHDVVERKLARGEALPAILASVLVAGEDVAPIELHLGAGQAVVEKQPNYPRHRNMEIDRRNPVVPIRLKLPTELTDLAPALEVVIRIAALFEGHDFGKLPAQQGECASCPHYADRHIVLVEHKHVAVQSGL